MCDGHTKITHRSSEHLEQIRILKHHSTLRVWVRQNYNGHNDQLPHKEKKPKRTWQWGEKTRFANAGSDISGGQGGNPGMRPSAVFQTDNDDLWRSSCRNALVVLANFSKSYGSRCPKIWQKYQRDSTLRKEVPHLEENIKRHVKQLSQFPRFFSGGPPLHLVAFWRCPWVCFHSFPGSAGSLNHWTGFSLHPWRFLAKELILCVGQSNYRVTVTKS